MSRQAHRFTTLRMVALGTFALPLSLGPACAKRTEYASPAPAVAANSGGGPVPDPRPNENDQVSAVAMVHPYAAVLARLPTASGPASPTASAPTAASDLTTQILGQWVFSRFDMSDQATQEHWSKVPPSMQKEILAELPAATLEITRDALKTRLAGVPEKGSTYSVQAADAGADVLVIVTSDEGRKRIRFPDPDTIRVETLDKKDDFVTFFVRKKPVPGAPGASNAPAAPAAPAVSAKGAKSRP